MQSYKDLIIINGRFLSQRMTGIQRFAYEICCALQHIGVKFILLAPKNVENCYKIDQLPIRIIGGKGSHYWEQVTLPLYVKRHYKGSVLIGLSGLNPIFYNRNILTIHDISYLLRPRSYSWLYCIYYQLMTPLVARRALKIITVSQFSKREIIEQLQIPANKIEVVYNAVKSSQLQAKDNSKRYILSVASLVPRKNLKRLLEAYSNIDNPNFELYLVGGSHSIYADAEVNAYIGHKGIHFLGYVSDDELNILYRNAIAYINPSLYEGFGIPNIEALMQECPLVVSDIPAFREVCGNAALYFDPNDVEDIQTKITTIMNNESLRMTLIKEGIKQHQLFSWEKSALCVQNIINCL